VRITRTVLVGAVAAVALAATAMPAVAAPSADSSTSFTAFSGALDITAPATVNLGSFMIGSSPAVSFGDVEVVDGRSEAPSSGTWTATVSSTDFNNPVAATTYPASNITYVVPSCAITGTTTCAPTAPITLSSSAQTVINASTSSTGSTATWNPQLQFTLPAGMAPGTYTGTVTHSVF
jgi:hypothetical protein